MRVRGACAHDQWCLRCRNPVCAGRLVGWKASGEFAAAFTTVSVHGDNQESRNPCPGIDSRDLFGQMSITFCGHQVLTVFTLSPFRVDALSTVG